MTAGEPHLVALAGSLRAESYTYRALELVCAEAEAVGATADLVDLSALDLPLFDPDAGEAGDASELSRRVDAADVVVLGTPMYHGSYSSPLKTALDYLGGEEFDGKTVGLLAVAGGSFPLPALEHLRTVCRSLGAWVLPHQVAIPTASDAFDGRTLTDADVEDRIETLAREAIRHVAIEPKLVPSECSDPSMYGSTSD